MFPRPFSIYMDNEGRFFFFFFLGPSEKNNRAPEIIIPPPLKKYRVLFSLVTDDVKKAFRAALDSCDDGVGARTSGAR